MNRFVIAAATVVSFFACGDTHASELAATAPAAERPLIVAADEGEVRVWRPLVSESAVEQRRDTATHFVIKVDRQHGNSPDFWFGTETLAPGAGIPYHRHLHEDEVLYVVSGRAHVHVGAVDGDAHAGTIVFIPRDTWVSIQSAGKMPISLLFAFNTPGFDRYMRCESVPLGQHPRPVSVAEDQRCSKLGDVQYR